MSDESDNAIPSDLISRYSTGELTLSDVAAALSLDEVETAKRLWRGEGRATCDDLLRARLLQKVFLLDRAATTALAGLMQIAREPRAVHEFAERNDVAILESQRKAYDNILNRSLQAARLGLTLTSPPKPKKRKNDDDG